MIDFNRKIHEQITPESWCQVDAIMFGRDFAGWFLSRYGFSDTEHSEAKRKLVPVMLRRLGIESYPGIRKIFEWGQTATYDEVLSVFKEADI